VLAGEPIVAELAQRIGLVNRVIPADELVDAAVRAGEAVARCGPLAVARAKRVLQQGQGVDPRTAHALEQNAFGLLFASEGCQEGMTAFLEKRDAVFRGR
jgi:enoyl-CoA hydratase